MRRWLPALSMMLITVISYIDRNTLALLAPAVLAETHLSVAQYGWAVSAYSVAFLIGNPMWGRIIDRVGLRVGMIAAVVIWTLASVSHSFVAGLASLAAARALLGFGEGAAGPGNLRSVLETLSAATRSRGIALTFSGGSLGAIVTPLVVTPVALAFGWRAAFWFTGLLGAGWLLFWPLASKNLSKHAVTSHSTTKPGFTDARLWSFMAAYALGALPLGFIVYSEALYLSRALGASQGLIGKVLWIPPLGSEVGIFLWGWLADRLGVRRLLPIATLLSFPLALLPWVHSLPIVLGEMFFAMFVASAFQILPLTYATQTFSHEHAGFLGGLASGSYGAALAVAMPGFGRLFDLHQYHLAFALAAALPALGFLTWRLINRYPVSSTQIQ